MSPGVVRELEKPEPVSQLKNKLASMFKQSDKGATSALDRIRVQSAV